ncbi:MAG: RNase adapter RapZ, partial [Actinomycetes bacterium]
MVAPEQILVITGMSGAGRSTAAHVLEDLGWYVVDNLPPALLSNLTSLPGMDEIQSAPRIAAVIDVRSRA